MSDHSKPITVTIFGWTGEVCESCEDQWPCETHRLRAALAEAEDARDAFAATYNAVNEVLLSGSTQRIDPTAERVHANLTRLSARTERAEKAERAALARAESAERERDDAIEDARAAAAQRLTEARRADTAEASLAQALEALVGLLAALDKCVTTVKCADDDLAVRMAWGRARALASALGRGG